MTRGRAAERWYGALIRLLPSSVRQEYGSDMMLTFGQRLAQRSGWRRLSFVARESWAVVRFGTTERLAPARGVVNSPDRGRMDVIGSNVRAGVRSLQRSPGFTMIAVLILAVGIGLTTAIFSALDAVLLRPSPYENPHELVNVERTESSVAPAVPWPHAHFEVVREWRGPFVDVAAHAARPVTLTGWGEPVRLTAEFVSDNYLNLLGVMPQLGRGFVPGGGERAVRDREVLLSDRVWRERFGGRDMLGAALTLNGKTAVVAGVLPAGFHGESGAAEIFAPVGLAPDVLGQPSLMQPFVMWLNVIARLRPGVTPESAAAQIMAMNETLRADQQNDISLGGEPLAVRPLHGSRIEPAFRRALLLTFGAATLVMLIVCLNISSLLLVRTQGRDRELAIRGALGASRGRLMGQLVTESLLLAIIGGVAGILIAKGALGALTALRPAPTPGFWAGYARALDVHDFRLDARVLAFTCVLTLLAGVASGVLPALRAYTLSFAARVRGDAGSGGAGGPGWARTRAGIVTAEIALAFMLVTAAGLIAASLAKMQREDLGFRAAEVTTMRLQLPASTHTLEVTAQFYAGLLERLSDLPGVISASLSTGLPVTATGGTTHLVPEGMTADDLPTIDVEIVSPRHFETLGIPLRSGREFTAADAVGTLPVIVSAATANFYWPGENPLGRRATVFVGRQNEPVEIVGVAADVQYGGVGEPVRPVVYVPVGRATVRSMYVNLRTSMPPAAAAAALRAEVSRLDPGLAMGEIRTMSDRVGAATSRARFSAVLVSAFAGVAAFLALLGVYGLVAYSVRSRSREFGVRLALGAQPRGMILVMLGDILRIAVIGVGLGLAGAFGVARVLQSQLYGVGATDPRALTAVGLLMLGAAAAAAWLPALRVLQISASAELLRD